MTTLVFDIETIPDVDSYKKLQNLSNLSDEEVATAMFSQRRQEAGIEFLRPHLHKICAISVVLEHQDSIKVWSIGEPHSSEQEIIQRFFDGLERFNPTLVSWNGCGFDLPVLHYRALLNGVECPHYWEVGENNPSFKFNNYLNRYQWRHTDLMDILSSFQTRMAIPLDQIATQLGFPGKMGMSGAKVWDNYQAGDIEGIRNYCETDVLNTYLVWLAFQNMRLKITKDQLTSQHEKLKRMLAQENKAHLTEFLKIWESNV